MTIISAIKVLNPIAVSVALISHFFIGIIWYHGFGKAWVALSGMELKPAVKWLPVGIAAHIIYMSVLAVIINLAEATTVFEGVIIGCMVSIGFIGSIMINELASKKIPFKLFLIKFGDEFISLCVAGVILALWR